MFGKKKRRLREETVNFILDSILKLSELVLELTLLIRRNREIAQNESNIQTVTISRMWDVIEDIKKTIAEKEVSENEQLFNSSPRKPRTPANKKCAGAGACSEPTPRKSNLKVGRNTNQLMGGGIKA